jgi:hypothetical protein
MRRGAAALTFPAVRAIVQEIFTALFGAILVGWTDFGGTL